MSKYPTGYYKQKLFTNVIKNAKLDDSGKGWRKLIYRDRRVEGSEVDSEFCNKRDVEVLVFKIR
jgi:hypothetical protein